MGENVIIFETKDIIVKESLDLGFNSIKFPYAYGEENIYFMLHQKFFPIQEYENSTEKHDYQYLYKKDGELKGGIADENEGVVKFGNDFINCKIIPYRDST